MGFSPYSEIIDKLQSELERTESILAQYRDEVGYKEDLNDYRNQIKRLSARNESLRLENERLKNAKPKTVRVEVIKQVEVLKTVYVEVPAPNKKTKHKKKSEEQNAFLREYNIARGYALQRDNYRCTECGSTDDLHVHHVVHRSKGGTNNMNNLTTLCKYCHAERHKGEPVYNIMRKALT